MEKPKKMYEIAGIKATAEAFNRGFNIALDKSDAFYNPLLAEKEKEIGRLRKIVELILPLAKGYVKDNRVGSNERYLEQAEAELQKGGS